MFTWQQTYLECNKKAAYKRSTPDFNVKRKVLFIFNKAVVESTGFGNSTKARDLKKLIKNKQTKIGSMLGSVLNLLELTAET